MTRPLQESDFVPIGKLAWIMVGTVVLTVGCLIWVWLVMKPVERADRGTAAPLPAVRMKVGGPNVAPVDQTLYSERTFYSAARLDHERQVLSSYGWVDQGKGIVRIPIARAMEIVAKEGKK